MKSFLDTLVQLCLCVESFIQKAPGLISVLTIMVPFFVLLTQIKRERKKGAIIIGEETEKLVSRWAYIDYVLNKSHPELYSILAEADTRRMKHFCQSEIMDVYSKKELEELKVLFAENTYNSKYSGSSALVFNVPSNVVREANNRFPQVKDEVCSAGFIYDYQHFFQKVVINTLNKMETLSLMMEKDIANEKIVYEAVGKHFLQMVKVLYYYIAKTNNTKQSGRHLPSDKSMKYLIAIFEKWKRRRNRERLIVTIKDRFRYYS